MHKKLIFTLLLFCSIFIFSGCGHPNHGIILFNKNPITKANLLNNANEFGIGNRLYYIFITEKPLKTNSIRVRILKRDEKANFQITKLVYSNDFRLSKDQVYYYTDYIVLHETGYYCMAIYATNSLDRPLAVGDFKIRN